MSRFFGLILCLVILGVSHRESGAIKVWPNNLARIREPDMLGPEKNYTVLPVKGRPVTHTFSDGGQKIKIISVPVPNPYMREYQLDRDCSLIEIAVFPRPLDSSSDEYHRIGSTGQSMVTALMRINGIDEVFVGHKHISIIIGQAFTWANLEPLILTAIKSVLLTGQAPVQLAVDKPQVSQDVRVVIESVENEQMFIFHTAQEISQETITFFFRGQNGFVYSGDKKNIGHLGRALVDSWESVTGVGEIFITPYTLSIILDQNHRWTTTRKKQAVDRIKSVIAQNNARN